MAQPSQRLAPLRVHAAVSGPICLPDGRIHLDSLLAYQVARERGLVCLDATMFEPIEIPVALEPQGRFYLCSAGYFTEAASELKYTIKRPILAEAQRFAGNMHRLQITAGANKAYRIPRPVSYLEDGVTWWCLGDEQEIRRLLTPITHLGKKRGSGNGVVDSWAIEPCNIWPGFPVLRDGRPLRPLPVDWPGASGPCGFRVLAPPYWDLSREEPCLLP